MTPKATFRIALVKPRRILRGSFSTPTPVVLIRGFVTPPERFVRIGVNASALGAYQKQSRLSYFETSTHVPNVGLGGSDVWNNF